MSHINKRVPKRRFEEFNNADDWEQRKLGELGEVTTGKAFSSTSFDNQGEYLVITNKNISDSSRSQNIITNRISISDDEIIQRYRLDGENILVTMDGVNLGKTAMYSNANALLAQRVGRIKSNQLEFIHQITSSNTFLKTMQTLSVGNAIKHISLKQISEYSSLGPKDIIERKKIGSFFKKLDNTIALHQRKLEKIKALKTAYLSEMFPAEGETKPKRRFARFTDDWEQCKLGELAEIVRGASPRPIQDPKWFDNNSEVGWLRISDVTAQDGRINYLEQRISEAGQEKTRVLKEPHLLLSIAATVGKPVINYVKTGVHDGFLIFLDIKFEQEFLFQWLEMFRTSWQKYGQPGSQVNLNSELVRNQEILIPSMKEQIKISQLFQQLDKTITLHQRKLKKLQSIKKAYLNEMFI
ncbi:restriction endonuclease subunit S [Listeria innocua]|uniref:restriction endonuclease subunit S n=1 Tax=Listeria innocua TaxID=1642 RepID=UPI00162568CF|nr:restriction endonuclease subunit S [Listeria innocua]MBC1393198.1 restriction endonuclease subunit S [Listeria innocua]